MHIVATQTQTSTRYKHTKHTDIFYEYTISTDTRQDMPVHTRDTKTPYTQVPDIHTRHKAIIHADTRYIHTQGTHILCTQLPDNAQWTNLNLQSGMRL